MVTRGVADLPTLPGYNPTWVDSGTSALALALLDARAKRPHIKAPEVIIPAYCCPDLVAAAEFAGVIPVVVDISSCDMAFNIETLEAQLTPNTLALIALTFLGVRENWTRLLPWLRDHYSQLLVIEDNAQWFPDLTGSEKFSADYLVFSFGRGKPLSLLGGGALFSALALAPEISAFCKKSRPARLQAAKYFAYNRLLQPNLYWFLNHNPVLKLGQTRFHRLLDISALDDHRLGLLGINFTAYQQRSRTLEIRYTQLLRSVGFYSKFLPMHSDRQQRLLRYPVLCQSPEQRDLLLKALNQRGLGASPLYQLPLPQIPGVADKIRCTNNIPHAENFAASLLTLPLHSGVHILHQEKIAAVFGRYC